MADQSPPTTARTASDDDQSRSLSLPGNRRIDFAVLLGAGGLSCIALVGWLWAGPVGLAVGVGIALSVIRNQPVVTAALAQAGLLVVVPELTTGRSLLAVAAFELGVVAILLSERPVEPSTVVLTVAFGAVLVAVVAATLIWTGLLATSVLLVCLVAIIGYGVHRFERVSLGLVSEPAASATESSAASTTTDSSQ